MRSSPRKSSFTLLLAIVFLFIACQQNSTSNQTTVFSGIAMTIPYQITVGSLMTDNEIDDMKTLIEGTFEEIDRIYNKYNPASELSSLNQLKQNEKKLISHDLSAMLQFVDHIVLLTDRKFDPTVEPMQRLWKRRLDEGKIPSESEIESLKNAIGWHRIHLQQGYFWKDHSSTEIDLGGIAKGYAVDLLAQRIVQKGFPNILVDWGGEFFAAGRHPERCSWRVSIRNPNPAQANQEIAIIPLQNQALATSGNYLQYWTVETSQGREIYSHILDPSTNKPIDFKSYPIVSASVAAPTCTLADAIATTAMIFHTREEVLEWSKSIEENLPGVRFWFVFHSEEYQPR